MTTKKKEFQLFKALISISKKNKDWYVGMSDDEKKKVAFIVVMRWLSGTDSMRQVVFLNEFVNLYTFNLYNHPELLSYLVTVCTSGKTQKHCWIKKSAKKVSFPKTVEMMQHYFSDYSPKQIVNLVFPMFTDEEMINCAEDLGYETDKIRPIKVELKKRK